MTIFQKTVIHVFLIKILFQIYSSATKLGQVKHNVMYTNYSKKNNNIDEKRIK